MYPKVSAYRSMNKSIRKTARLIITLLLFCSILTSLPLAGHAENSEKKQAVSLPQLTDIRPTEAKENTFTTLNGNEVTYNMNTRRIIALSGAGDLAAFGIHPLAVLSDPQNIEMYQDYFEGVKILEYSQPYNIEEILSYEPELILVYQMMDEKNIEELSKIAPVIPLHRESFDFSERLGYIGEIFGLEENAKQLVQYAEQTKESALKEIESLGIKDKSVTIFYYFDAVSIPPSDFWYFNKIIYDYLELEMPEAVRSFLNEPNHMPFSPISNEVLPSFEGDGVLYADLMGDMQIPESLAANPGWMALKAVKEDKVGVLNALLYAEKDVLYLQEQYSGILAALNKAFGQ